MCPSAAPIKAKPANRRANGSSSQMAGPSKRKNLDEIKESERIEMLEQRLRDFENSGGDRRNSAAAPTPAAAHDVASSDSSSEDDSGSDSDDED